VASGVLFAVAAGSHGIPAFVLMLGLACYAAALLLVVGERRAVVLRGLAIVGVTVLIWGASLGLSGGDVGFQGAGGSNRYSSFPPNVDPTASLFTGHVVDRATADGHWYIAPASLTRGLVASAITRPASDLELWAVPLLAIAIALMMLFRFRDELRPLGVFVVLLAALLLGIALLFSYRYSTYIPGTFGPHRLYDYICLLALLLVLGCLEQAVGLLSRLRAGLPAVVCAVAVLATAATAAYAGAPARHGWQQNGQRAEHVTSWVDANLPCSSRLLVDRLTLGTFAAETGRVSVAEGMGPYLRPSELHTVLDLVLGAHGFFQDPSAHREFLRKQMIDYVLVLKNVRVGSMVSTLEQGVDPAGFHGVPFLRLVHSDDTMDVYQVVDPARGSAPSPKNYAGFDCRT
jgi:hypothetical protein